MAGNPVKMSGFQDAQTRRPAPGLNADGDRLRTEMPPLDNKKPEQ
jgi:hypothetical protein